MTSQSILIVEDSAADRMLYRHCLSAVPGARYRTHEVESVAGALEFLSRETPDCILLDYLLPDGTGLDLVDALVAQHGRLTLPVVMLTGEGSEDVAVRAMKAGVLDYAIKGTVNAESLTRAIDNALDKAHLQRELARRGQELEQLAYVVSHDLRAPLRTVHQNGELLGRLAGEALDEGARAHLERMLASTRRMDALIVDLVGYCRIGGERPFEAVALGPLLDQVLSDLEAQVLEADAEIEVNELPVVWGDPLRLRQLFQNLVGNALKFRQAGRELRVVVDARPDEGGHRIAVSDNGTGIDSEDFESIFRVFQRLPGTAEIPGTGIGLAICRRIVDHHGGRIEVESEPGVGTTFSFVLAQPGEPAKPAEAP